MTEAIGAIAATLAGVGYGLIGLMLFITVSAVAWAAYVAKDVIENDWRFD